MYFISCTILNNVQPFHLEMGVFFPRLKGTEENWTENQRDSVSFSVRFPKLGPTDLHLWAGDKGAHLSLVFPASGGESPPPSSRQSSLSASQAC